MLAVPKYEIQLLTVTYEAVLYWPPALPLPAFLGVLPPPLLELQTVFQSCLMHSCLRAFALPIAFAYSNLH